MSSTLNRLKDFLAFALICTCGFLPFARADDNVSVGRINLKCERHNVSAPPWTNSIQASKPVCTENAKDIKAKQEEHAQRIKRSGEVTQKAAATQVASGKDLASFVDSMKSIYKGGIQEYENLAEQSKKAADDLKKKQPQNEEAIRNLQAELRKVEGDQRQKIVEIEKIKLLIRREMADTATAQTVHNLDSLNSQKSQKEKEKEPIDKVLSEKYHLRAVEEQSHVVTASKSMESVLREAQRNFLAKRDDLNSKLAKVDAIKTDSGVSGDDKEKTEKLAKDLEATPKTSPKKYEDSAFSKGLDKTKDWLYSPVDPTVAAKKDEMTESLKAASEDKPEKAAEVGTEATANKATKDALTLDGPTTGEGANRKLVAAGYDAAQDGDIKTSSPDAPIQKRIVEANEGLAEKNLTAQEADMEAKGGAKGVRSEAEDTIKKVQEADKKIEQTARGMPMDSGAFSKGTVDKLDESSPYYEKQKQLKEDIDNRNKIVEEACSSPSVCRAVTNVAGVKREVGTSDLAVQGVGVRSAAERQNDEMYKLNDNAGIGLKQISKPSAEKAIEDDHTQSIAAARSAVEESQKRANDLTASSTSVERMKESDVSLTRVHSTQEKVESQQNEFITTNAVAAGAVLKNANGDQATTDKINDALRAGDSHNRTMGGVVGMLPGAAGYEAYKASGDADNAAAQVPLAGNSLKASQAATEANKEFEGKFNGAVVSAGMAAAPGGSMTGELVAKGATSFAEHTGVRAAESAAVRTVSSDVERASVREAESAGSRIAETRVAEPAPAYEAPHAQPAPVRAAEVEEAPVPIPKEPAHVAAAEPAHEVPEPRTVEPAPASRQPEAVPHEAPAPAPREIAKAEPTPREAPTQKPLARAEETAPKAEPIRQDNSPYAPRNAAPSAPETHVRVAQVEEEAPAPTVRVHQSEPAPSAAVSRHAPAEEVVAESASDVRRSQDFDFSSGSSGARSAPAPQSSQPRIASRPASAPTPAPSVLRQDNTISSASRSGKINEVSSPAAARREIAVVEQPREQVVSEVQGSEFRNTPNSARAEPALQKTQNNTIARVESISPGREPAAFAQDNFPRSSPGRAEALNAGKNTNAAEAELAAINKNQPHGVEMPTDSAGAPKQRPSYDSSRDSLRTRIAASESEDKGFFQRQKERISDMGSKLKEKINGTSEEPSKWKVVSSEKESSSKWKPADDTPSRSLDRPLSEVPKDHPSNDQVALLNKLEDGHDVKVGTLEKDSGTRGNWVKEDHQINLNENLLGSEEKVQAKSTVVHESVHMTTDVKNISERQSWFLSDSERVYGDKRLGSYSKQAKADEVEARVKQLASYRLDRQRAEQKLVTATGADRKALRAEIEKIKKMEKITLNRARIMIARERELTLGALRTLDDPMKAMGVTKPKLIPAKDSFVYRFTDEEGRTQVYRDLIPQYKNLSVAEAKTARSRDIVGMVKKEFGENSAAAKGLYKIDGKPGSPAISLKRDAVKERTVRSYELSTGVDDVKMIGYLDASKPASREAASEILERRLSQLDAREAHLEKHYGLDKKTYDFGSTYGEAKAESLSQKSSGKLTPKSEDEFIKEIEATEKQAAESRPWGEESPKEKPLSPFAERSQTVYEAKPSAVRDPATVRDPQRKWDHLEKEHATFRDIEEADNIAAKPMAEAANAGKPTEIKKAATMQAAVGKAANDEIIKNKDKVNYIFNLQKQLIWDKVAADPLLSKHLVGKYSDFNNVKMFFNSDSKAIDARLKGIFTEYNQRFSGYLDSVAKAEGWEAKSVGIAEKRENWHHLGIGKTPDEANIAARKSRELLDENGFSRPRNFDDKEVQELVTKDLKATEESRSILAERFKDQNGVLAGEEGREVLSAKAIDAIKKADQTDAGVKKALEGKFTGTKFTDQDVKEMRKYVAKADSFSPDLYVGKRVETSLDARPHGALSADYAGQGSRNLEGTMGALAGIEGKTMDEQIRAIRGVRAAEMKATEILDQMKRDFFGTVDKHLGKEDPHLRKFTYESGDDTIVLPSKPLTHAQERAIVADLAEKPNTVRTTINPSRYADNGKVIPPGLRSEYVVRAEKMEKDLRKVMAGPFTSQELDNSQIVVKMRPRSDGTKSVGIYLGGKNSVEIAQKMESWTKNFLKEQKIRTDFVETISRPKNITEAALAASEETAERLRNAENSLGRELTPRQQNAVIRAHEVGEGKAGKAINGDMPAAKGNYSLSQIREKERILRNEGFTTGEIRSLMDEGVVGSEGGLRKPASSATSDGAGIKLSSDLKSGDSRVVSSREEAYLIEEDLMPKGIAENRDNWLKSGESSDFEDYGKSVAPEESKSEFKRLADLKNPANMPASPGAAYYQQQVNYTKGQLELLSNFHNEDAFGGLEKVMDQQFKLEEELKKSQMALKNARAQGRP